METIMHFAYPQGRGWLILALAVAALAATALVRKRRALRRLAGRGIHQPGVLVRPGRQLVNCGLLWLAALLLGIALLGPQVGWIEQEIPPRSGRDVLIVLDVSRSMLAEDVAPNRLERAKADLRDLADALERIGGYRIGLIAFAERAAVLCPLTFDYRCFAEELSVASLASLRLRGRASWGDGTQIGAALDRAAQAIDDDNAAYTDVLLVSDGDDMARETLKAADALARRGIAVNTLGLGDPDHGSLIPVRDGLGRLTYLRYRKELVYTHLQETVLRRIAERAHGRYFAVGTGYLDLAREFGELLADKENRARRPIQRERHGIQRFQWFVAPALSLLLLQWLLTETRRPGDAAPEKTDYFRWVRLVAVENKAMRALAVVFLSLVLLASTSTPRTSAEPNEPLAPWTAFRRGNQLLRRAQEAGAKADPAWLIQAQQQYRKCLARQSATPEAATPFADARYNLEVAKLLLMQVSRSGTNAGSPQPESAAEGGSSTSPNDKKDKGARQMANSGSSATMADAAAEPEARESSGQQNNAAAQTAVMRLRQAIERIENHRGQRVINRAPGPEDPAHLNRYRDW
jgi:Ca-activated chloride channel family protein